MEARGTALPPFAGPPRDPENLSTSDVNKRITRYVGVGLYDDLTCEPDRTGLGLDDVGANPFLRALKYLVADRLGQLGLRGPLGNATEV